MYLLVDTYNTSDLRDQIIPLAYKQSVFDISHNRVYLAFFASLSRTV